LLSKISRHTHNYIYILEFVMHTPLYNHIMIIRCELWRASARERECCNTLYTPEKCESATSFFFSSKKSATQTNNTALRPSLEKKA